jgi:hypothetical protein
VNAHLYPWGRGDMGFRREIRLPNEVFGCITPLITIEHMHHAQPL